VAVDGSGNLYIADTSNDRIRKVSPAGIITTVAGNGKSYGPLGDGGPATSARLNKPSGVAVDRLGNLYIADAGNCRIRKVSPTSIITTVAGNGTQGSSGDGGPATSAELYFPQGVTVDRSGNLYIADRVVRKVSPAGMIATAAGSGKGYGPSGDGGAATSARLYDAERVALDGLGNLYIADVDGNPTTEDSRIRKVSPVGVITTVAGGGSSRGDGGPATNAQLFRPSDVAVDGSGNLYISDADSCRIRKVSPAGIITTVAGNGDRGYSGDGGPATGAELLEPTGLAVDGSGRIYIADKGGNAVRILTPTWSNSTPRPR
jgi:sugar lactone lactonase YvrE